MQTIDLNCDLGEGFGNYQYPDDAVLMNYITSVNIACGFHAGDPEVMRRTVLMAVQKGVAVGAHPGLPDLQGFGRRELKITPAEAYQITLYQIGALHGFVKAAGAQLNHVKPHGALYNMAAKDFALAEAIVQAVKDFNPELILYALSGSEMIKAANVHGLTSASEVFADRSYQDDGTLTPRNQGNAMIENAQSALEQVLMMVKHQNVISTHQNTIAIKAETICLHGDGKHAVQFAESIRLGLTDNGIAIKAFTR